MEIIRHNMLHHWHTVLTLTYPVNNLHKSLKLTQRGNVISSESYGRCRTTLNGTDFCLFLATPDAVRVDVVIISSWQLLAVRGVSVSVDCLTIGSSMTIGRRVDWLALSAALRADVGPVEELWKEEHHGPRVPEDDRIVEPWVVAVDTDKLVVGRVADDRYELDLMTTNKNTTIC